MVGQLSKTEIIYPESDGKPMADNTKQFRWILTIQQNIDWLYTNDPQVFVAGDLFWYPVQGQNTIVTAPDVMVAFGRPKGRRGSYKQWMEDDIPPQVAFEILSPSNKDRRGLDSLEEKLEFYEKYGSQEYYIYDPDDLILEGWQRQGDRLFRSASMISWVSPLLGIRFDWVAGEELVISRPDGQRFLSPVQLAKRLQQTDLQLKLETQHSEQETLRADRQFQRAEQEYQRAEQEAQRAELEAQRAEQEAQRAEQEAQRAEQEAQRAEQERQRADRLAERLKALGIDEI